MARPDLLPYFAATAPGLEALTAEELRALGAKPVKAEPGGVAFGGPEAMLLRANLWLRTASRVLVRIGQFRAAAFHELERHARKLPFERYLAPGEPVRLSVTCRKSRLYHSKAVAERVLDAIAHRVGSVGQSSVGAEDDDADTDTSEAGPQRLQVRFFHDVCTVSADSSGELLHRRGWRQAVAHAPLRENLAAAMLLGSGYRGQAPLVDPMCGSGTLAIEAALLARGAAPGLARSFAFERWPSHAAKKWQAMKDEARGKMLARSPVAIVGSDRHAGAIAAARSNAERAGVAEDVVFQVRPLDQLPAESGPGWLVANPPYGVRIGEDSQLVPLYAELGRMVRERRAGWTVALLIPRDRLAAATGLGLKEAFHTRNGGISVRCLVAG